MYVLALTSAAFSIVYLRVKEKLTSYIFTLADLVLVQG